MTDESDRRPRWDEDAANRKARDFVDPPPEAPPDEDVPVDPPEDNDTSGEE